MVNVFIILGAPGSGKGTQAKRLAQKLGLVYFGTGDLMRQEVEKATPIGMEFKEVLQRGGLVNDNLVEKFVSQKLEELNIDKGIVFDGYPRTISQAEYLENIIHKKGLEKLKVLNLTVKPESLIARMQKRRICEKCGKVFRDAVDEGRTTCDCQGQLIIRDDDKPEVVRQRIEVYEKQTAALIDYYQKQGKLINVDGEPPIDEVWEEIQKIV